MHYAAAGFAFRQFPSDSVQRRLMRDLLLAACVFAASGLYAQNSAQTPATAQTQQPAAQTPAAPQKPAPVTTTVVVHGETNDSYLPESVVVGTLDGTPIREAPLSATAITREVLNDQISRLLSDVVKNDASVENDYVPVGYYGDYQIRGFAVDLATGFEITSHSGC